MWWTTCLQDSNDEQPNGDRPAVAAVRDAGEVRSYEAIYERDKDMFRHLIRTALKTCSRSAPRGRKRSFPAAFRPKRLLVESLESRLLLAPVISTSRSPLSPTASTAVLVTSQITDTASITSATLTYSTGSGTSTQSTPFTETFGSTAVKPWTGSTGAENTWTVTGNYCELATNCNYDTLDSSTCGLTYKGQATANALTGAMIATANGISAAGASGYVQFYLLEDSLSGTDGWAFQVDPTGTGNSYVTCLSDSTFAENNQGWQEYQYTLTSSQLVSGLKMRFQFSGGGSGDTGRIFLDDITVVVTSGSTPTTTAMTGANGAYSADIPAQPAGTTVNYYVTAEDSAGLRLPIQRLPPPQPIPIRSGRPPRRRPSPAPLGRRPP